MGQEVKTGQTIDVLKSKVLIPHLSNAIERHIHPDRRGNIVLLDFGTGDASTLALLLNKLEGHGVYTGSLGLVDKDLRILPDALYQALKWMDDGVERSVFLVESEEGMYFAPSLSGQENVFDVINMHLVLHQIPNDAEYLLLLCRALFSLRDDGILVITDLSPDYINYLMEFEPSKFKVYDEGQRDTISGEYLYDSGGSSYVKSRNIPSIVASLIGTGFRLIEVSSPSLIQAVGLKARYSRLHKLGVDMFYTLVCMKDRERFISFSEIRVKSVGVSRHRNLQLITSEDEELIIPSFERWDQIEENDRVVLLETLLPDGRPCLNLWVLPRDGKREIWMRFLILSEQ